MKKEGLKNCNDPNVFIEYLNNMDDIHEGIAEYNPGKNVKY